MQILKFGWIENICARKYYLIKKTVENIPLFTSFQHTKLFFFHDEYFWPHISFFLSHLDLSNDI